MDDQFVKKNREFMGEEVTLTLKRRTLVTISCFFKASATQACEPTKEAEEYMQKALGFPGEIPATQAENILLDIMDSVNALSEGMKAIGAEAEEYFTEEELEHVETAQGEFDLLATTDKSLPN